uniref:Protein kinase domain-containing protein n=1 Tax=Glossina pallidipes TaxID=7398 RepID=A0A1B0A9R2_GLOPL
MELLSFKFVQLSVSPLTRRLKCKLFTVNPYNLYYFTHDFNCNDIIRFSVSPSDRHGCELTDLKAVNCDFNIREDIVNAFNKSKCWSIFWKREADKRILNRWQSNIVFDIRTEHLSNVHDFAPPVTNGGSNNSNTAETTCMVVLCGALIAAAAAIFLMESRNEVHRPLTNATSQTQPRLKPIKRIGNGTFGYVYEVEDTEDKKRYALKCITLPKDKEEAQKCMREAYNLAQLKDHQNIVKYVRSERSEEHLSILMELCNTNLASWLEKNRMELNTKHISKIFHQLVDAVYYIHSNGIIHRDLKPENIFVNEADIHIKIGDFGLSTNNKALHSGVKGTEHYMSPEQLRGQRDYTFKVDIYALGLILLELYEDIRADNVINLLRKGVFPNAFERKHPKVHELLKKMLAENPKLRPSAQDLQNILKPMNS